MGAMHGVGEGVLALQPRAWDAVVEALPELAVAGEHGGKVVHERRLEGLVARGAVALEDAEEQRRCREMHAGAACRRQQVLEALAPRVRRDDGRLLRQLPVDAQQAQRGLLAAALRQVRAHLQQGFRRGKPD